LKVYLVNPLFNPAIWSFEGLRPFTGTRFYTAPLGLATVAALTPAPWEVEIVDENVEPINFDIDADLIGVTAFNVQHKRAVEIAAEFRKRGKKVAFGGPYCSLFPEAFEGLGDHRIVGEAEVIWAKFLADFEAGEAKELYVAEGRANVAESPIPRYDLIKPQHYNVFNLQTSRGCPFQCEFCDIIVMDGRVPRTKTVEQVLAEVDHCVKMGAHYIMFGDANFIGNIPFARKLLTALAEYQRKHGYPVELACELTINVAHHDDLLKLLQDANFYSVFVGIESPRSASLIETKKLQNTRKSMQEDIARIHSYHVSVAAGMIVGFDSDDKYIFQEQFDYLKELGIPFTTCGTLMALPNTPLLKRLQAEGRLLDSQWTEMSGHGAADCNFIPKLMTHQELSIGYNWLIRALYRYDSYSDRLVTVLNRFENRNPEHKKVSVEPKLLGILAKIVIYYLFTFNHERRHFFTSTFARVWKGGPFSVGKWLQFFMWTANHRAFRDYVIKTHGIPETADPQRSPYERPAAGPVAIPSKVEASVPLPEVAIETVSRESTLKPGM